MAHGGRLSKDNNKTVDSSSRVKIYLFLHSDSELRRVVRVKIQLNVTRRSRVINLVLFVSTVQCTVAGCSRFNPLCAVGFGN
jgi:hypothetical protein